MNVQSSIFMCIYLYFLFMTLLRIAGQQNVVGRMFKKNDNLSKNELDAALVNLTVRISTFL